MYKSNMYIEDAVIYMHNCTRSSSYYRCIVDGQQAEFTDNQIQVAIKRATKHQDSKYKLHTTLFERSPEHFSISRYFSKLFKKS